MNRNRTTFSNTAGYRTRDLQGIRPGCRYTAIGNREGYELNPARAAKFSFALQSEFGNLLPFEKTDDRIQTGGLPFADLRLQPIISAGTRGNRYPPGRRYLNPM